MTIFRAKQYFLETSSVSSHKHLGQRAQDSVTSPEQCPRPSRTPSWICSQASFSQEPFPHESHLIGNINQATGSRNVSADSLRAVRAGLGLSPANSLPFHVGSMAHIPLSQAVLAMLAPLVFPHLPGRLMLSGLAWPVCQWTVPCVTLTGNRLCLATCHFSTQVVSKTQRAHHCAH